MKLSSKTEESGALLEKTIAAIARIEVRLDELISCEIEAAQLSEMDRLIETGGLPVEAAEVLN